MEPHVAFGGDSAGIAATRFLEAKRTDPALVHAFGDPTLNSMELQIPTDPCPDCKRSGKYTGLNTIEDCGNCGGSGVRIW